MARTPCASQSPQPCTVAIFSTSASAASAVTPVRHDAIQFGGGDDAPLEHLHHEAEHAAHADRIHAVFVAVPVQLDDRLAVADGAVRAQGEDRLVFRPFDDGAIDQRLGPLAAADRAAEAGVILLPVVFAERRAGDLVGVLKAPALEVARRQRAHHVHDFENVGRPFAVEHARLAGHAHGAIGQLQGAIVGRAVENLHGAGAAYRNGLQVLRSHHRADATAGQCAALVEDPRDVSLLLAGRADDQRLPAAPQDLVHLLGRGGDGRAPQVISGADLDQIIVDDDHHGRSAAPVMTSAS